MIDIKRTYRGVYLNGRRRYMTVKWLRPGVTAIRSGLWQVQVGRLLVRVAWQLRRCGCCGRYHAPVSKPLAGWLACT